MADSGKWYFAAAVVTAISMVAINLYVIHRTGAINVPISLPAAEAAAGAAAAAGRGARKPWRR